MKTVLVTGGAGFIGSRFIEHMLGKYPAYRIVNADALTYAGQLEHLAAVEGNPRYAFVKADIRDPEKINALFAEYGFDYVVNLAAETHVDRSINDPAPFLSTNVLGAGVLLDAALKLWRAPDGTYKSGARFLQASTDEVYGALEGSTAFTEMSPLLPRNPYAASQAAADMLARAYFITHGLPVAVARSSNNYGPRQFPEKLIPLAVKCCAEGRPVPVYGDGSQLRDWLHVDDNCAALDIILHEGLPGEAYNVSGGCERKNLEVVRRIAELAGEPSCVEHVADRPGHDRRYFMDASKLKRLGWRPKRAFEEGLKETVAWHLARVGYKINDLEVWK